MVILPTFHPQSNYTLIQKHFYEEKSSLTNYEISSSLLNASFSVSVPTITYPSHNQRERSIERHRVEQKG